MRVTYRGHSVDVTDDSLLAMQVAAATLQQMARAA